MKTSLCLLGCLLTLPVFAIHAQNLSPAQQESIASGGQGRLIDTPMLDLNGDGTVDAIVVKDQDGKPGDNRDIVLLFRNDKGQLHPAWHNNRIVPCGTCGGGTDPYQGTEAETGRFTVNLAGGGREKWSESYVFSFDKKANRFYLTSVEKAVTDNESGQTRQQAWSTRDFGRVEFSDFDPKSIPEVTMAARTPSSSPAFSPRTPSASIAGTCPAGDFAGFLAVFADSTDAQHRYTTDPVEGEVLNSDGRPQSRPWRQSELAFPLIPVQAKRNAQGVRMEVASKGDVERVKVYKPDTDYQIYYTFRKTGGCWELFRIEDESL
jgi:hypothetical protein